MSDPTPIPSEPVPDDVGLLDVEERVDEVVLRPGDGDDPGPYPAGTFRKIASGMVTLALLVTSTYLVEALHWARPWVPGDDPMLFWNLLGRELLGEGEVVEEAAERLELAERMATEVGERSEEDPLPPIEVIEPPPPGSQLPPYEPHPDDAESVPRSLELPDPAALDGFYAQLARTNAGYAGAITRVSHWGDSAIANDNIASSLRFEMQRRFGDAGHGFHLMAKPHASYRHQGVRFSDGEMWQMCYIINKCQRDGRYGLGGTVVWSPGGGDSRWKTEIKLPYGQSLSRLEVWYRAQPKGGRLRIKVDRDEPRLVPTAADEAHDAWHTVELDDGPHAIGVRAGPGGQVRAYGVVLERDGPGVVWDGLAQVGAFSRKMLLFDPEHLRGQIDHRDPDLLVFTFGGNDLTIAETKLARYEEDFGRMLRLFRGGDEPRACLVMAPVDHGIREGQRIVSTPMVARIIEIQRTVALAEGCAFFDTVAAMGGEGAAGRWRQSTPPLLSGDLAHLTHAGQKVIGHMVYLALMEGYVEYRGREGRP